MKVAKCCLVHSSVFFAKSMGRWGVLQVWALSLLLLAAAMPAAAQLTTQQIPLGPGWNAVFLEVTPEDRACEAVFRGLPIASVWRWNPKTATHQFIEDPSKLAPEDPDWLVYFPPTSEENALSTLHAIHGGRPYLIHLRGSLPATLSVKGKPVMQSLKWQADSFNFVGFSLSSSQAPTFQAFFAPSAAHTGQAMYRMGAEGRWERIADPASTHLEENRGYWVYCAGHSEYQGPTLVTAAQGRGIDFNELLVESKLQIKNESGAEKTYTLTLSDSEAPDTETLPALAGATALSYWKSDYASEDVGWRAFTAPITIAVGAGKEEEVRFAVRRADLAPYVPQGGESDYTYQSLLTIEDGAGLRLRAPVSARGLPNAADKAGGLHPRAGLWVGAVTLNKVSEHVPRRESEGVHPTASEFQMKIILHVDAQGAPKLLRQVTQLWRPGTYKPDPNNPPMEMVDQPGSYALFTDFDKIDAYIAAGKLEGAVLRDGTPAGRRISTSIFPFNEPLSLTGAFPTPANPASIVTGEVALDYDDPLNPFKHKYHPDHNNLKPDYATMLDEGLESWTVIRRLTFAFTATDPEMPEGAQSGWGDTQIGGVYTEVIEGLHRDDITVEGVFRLSRVSKVAELDPDL